MEKIEKSINVHAPIQTVYNQWTQFEEFPRFMEGVKSVKQLDDKRLHWVAEIGGQEKEWNARITEQVPDRKIAWQSEAGEYTSGAVTFQAAGKNRTRINLELSYDPKGFVENTGDALGFVSGRVKGDLARFKDFIEHRGQETGAWRGTIRS
ncbi:MAG TPA: SRPBCC family protein [Candidatus Binatia bacterium]|nr:SRPBCC family protein [Candidatus Binatia bacterium]